MIEEKVDENLEETPEEETEETEEETEEEPEGESEEEPSEEPEPEPEITLKETYDLAKALQKGYTVSRQQMSQIRQNQDKIQEALTKLGEKEEKPIGDLDDQLTVGQYLKLEERKERKRIERDEREKQIKTEKDAKIETLIDSQVDELKAQGVIKSKQDEEDLMAYAVKHKIKNLLNAAPQWQELKEAQGIKAKAKNKVKQEAGSKVGTSTKTKTGESKEIPYDEIHTKEMDELVE